MKKLVSKLSLKTNKIVSLSATQAQQIVGGGVIVHEKSAKGC